jgi:preprotein translocase subunit SecF
MKKNKKNKKQKKSLKQETKKEKIIVSDKKEENSNVLLKFYESKYKILLVIPFLMLFFAIIQIGYQYSTTGDFIVKDISLKGGVSITIPVDEAVDNLEIQNYLQEKGFSVNVRNVGSGSRTIGVLFEADVDFSDEERINELLLLINDKILVGNDYSLEGVGSTIGDSFFKQALIALLFSFLIMSIIVGINFRTFVPSFAVILSAFSDIVVTVAIANIIGIKFSTAGIAALLMMIGYSVDTDILLATRVLKRKSGTVFSRVISAMKTGILMNFTTLVAISIGLFVSSSDVIKQIMIILFIGLFVDQINTWIQNVGILRLYMERRNKGEEKNE